MSIPLYDSGIASGLLSGILFGYALEAAGFGEVDYAEVRRDGDLALVEGQPDGAARVFVAVWLDGVRLIDNVEIGDLRSLAAE